MPDEIIQNRMFMDKAEEEEFNSPENVLKCEKVFENLRASNRTIKQTTAAEKMILDKCDLMLEGPWDIVGGGCSWYCGEHVDTVISSSALANQGSFSYGVENIFDLSYKTAWVEGVEGYGIGEKITYVFPEDHPRVTKIIVVNGYVYSEKAWFENSRVKQLNVYVNDALFAVLTLKDTKNDQVFKFEPIGHFKTGDWKLTFEIVDVYEGDLYDDTAITEIYFDGIDVH